LRFHFKFEPLRLLIPRLLADLLHLSQPFAQAQASVCFQLRRRCWRLILRLNQWLSDDAQVCSGGRGATMLRMSHHRSPKFRHLHRLRAPKRHLLLSEVVAVEFYIYLPLLATESRDSTAKLWLLDTGGTRNVCVAWQRQRCRRSRFSPAPAAADGGELGRNCEAVTMIIRCIGRAGVI
jgi:hypothetical protein